MIRLTARPGRPPVLAARTLVLACLLGGVPAGNAETAVGVFTQHNDNARSGFVTESMLTPGNVNSVTFGKRFSHTADGYVYAQPLYVPGVNIPGKGVHNVVYVATAHDSVYAFDADDAIGLNSDPLWRTSFIRPDSGITTLTPADIYKCTDLGPEVGITGTPVIDAATGTLYVVAATREGKTYHQRLHALDIATGAEKLGGPVDITSTLRAVSDAPSGKRKEFTPQVQLQRAALLLAGNVVYVAFASYCDRGTYHGWVMGYDAGTLRRLGVFNDTPVGQDGGIWHGGAGLSADAGGLIYFVTGNGTFGKKGSKMNYGDCVIKASSNGRLTPLDYFAPYNQDYLSANDIDLGSCGALLLPDQPGPHPHLLVTAGKEGRIYVLDRDNLGRFHSGSDSQIVQSLPGALGEAFGMPAVFNSTVYFCAMGDPMKAYPILDGRLSSSPASQSSTIFPFPGATPAVSANGLTDGIVWAIEKAEGPGGLVLHAYEATDLSHELYSSTQAGSRDYAGEGVKFTVPTVANGKVYVGAAWMLTAFGLF